MIYSRNFKLLVFIFCCIILFSCESNEKNKPNNVPKSAFHYGGWKMGNYWIDFVSKTNDSTYRYRIYSGIDGKLIKDAEYILDNDCINIIKNENDIREKFRHYGNAYIRVYAPNTKGFCDLIEKKKD